RTEVVDNAFERLNLGGELAGGCAIAGVFDLKQRVGAAKLIDFDSGAPPRPQPDQHRHHHYAEHGGDGRAQTDGNAAKDAARTVSNNDGVAPCAHALTTMPAGFRETRKGS